MSLKFPRERRSKKTEPIKHRGNQNIKHIETDCMFVMLLYFMKKSNASLKMQTMAYCYAGLVLVFMAGRL